MTKEQAIQFLCAQVSVRYEHMRPSEQRTFLQCVMVLAPAHEAELAARALHTLAAADELQGELFASLVKPAAPVL